MNVFDIIGPVMIGPSSSHTAGAARIGQVARELLGEEPKSVHFKLHGSFAKTGKGHGTDMALLGGVMGFEIDDERIKESFEFADRRGLKYSFEEADLGFVHPNTVETCLTGEHNKSITVQASSIGGGRIEVTKIDGNTVSFFAELHTLIVFHKDRPGVVAAITGELAKQKINIAYMKLYREFKGEKAASIIETDECISERCVDTLKTFDHVDRLVYIHPIGKR